MRYDRTRRQLPPSPPLAQMWALEQLANDMTSIERLGVGKNTRAKRRKGQRLLIALWRPAI